MKRGSIPGGPAPIHKVASEQQDLQHDVDESQQTGDEVGDTHSTQQHRDHLKA